MIITINFEIFLICLYCELFLLCNFILFIFINLKNKYDNLLKEYNKQLKNLPGIENQIKNEVNISPAIFINTDNL